MAVGHLDSSASHGGATSTSEASFTWNLAPGVGVTPDWVLVFVYTYSVTETATGVTYDSVSLVKDTGGTAIDSADEIARIDTYFLDGGAWGSGTKAVVVNRTNNAVEMYAFAIAGSGTNTEVHGIVLEQENQVLTEENVDDGTPGTNSIRYAAIYWGGSSVLAAGANSTTIESNDTGVEVAQLEQETTAGQGSRPVGISSGAGSDDVAAVYLAIREAPVGGGFVSIAIIGV